MDGECLFTSVTSLAKLVVNKSFKIYQHWLLKMNSCFTLGWTVISLLTNYGLTFHQLMLHEVKHT